MTQQLGWGIIGIGNHAERKMAPAINGAKECRLVAVYSRDPGRAESFAQKHNAEAGYDSIPDLLRHPGLDVVYVASPNALHREHVIMAARAGKHVLCEKPMALRSEECASMVEACQRQGVKLGVGFHLRHHPGHQEARRLIAQGILGKPVLCQGQWARGVRGQTVIPPATGLHAWWSDPAMAGGGAVMGTGVHVIDLLRFLTGQEVAEVCALTDGQTDAHPLDSLAVALLQFADGALGTLVASRLIPDPANDVAVYGSNGRSLGRNTLGTDLGGRLEVASDQVNTVVAYTSGDMFRNQVEAFNRCVREGEEPSASGLDGLRACQVTEAIFTSAREGRRVTVPSL